MQFSFSLPRAVVLEFMRYSHLNKGYAKQPIRPALWTSGIPNQIFAVI
jgi:hypothetical protein